MPNTKVKLVKIVKEKEAWLPHVGTLASQTLRFVDHLIANGVAVQKHGRWEVVCKNVRKCSNCNKERNTDVQRGWYSCPFCGAIMDVEKLL